MADRDFNIVVRIDGDSDSFTASLKIADEALADLRKDLDRLKADLNTSVGSLQSVTAELGHMAAELKDASINVGVLSATTIDLSRAQIGLATTLGGVSGKARDSTASLSGATTASDLAATATRRLAVDSTEAAAAIEAETRAVDGLGDAALRTAAELATIDQNRELLFNIGKAADSVRRGPQQDSLLNAANAVRGSLPENADMRGLAAEYERLIRLRNTLGGGGLMTGPSPPGYAFAQQAEQMSLLGAEMDRLSREREKFDSQMSLFGREDNTRHPGHGWSLGAKDTKASAGMFIDFAELQKVSEGERNAAVNARLLKMQLDALDKPHLTSLEADILALHRLADAEDEAGNAAVRRAAKTDAANAATDNGGGGLLSTMGGLLWHRNALAGGGGGGRRVGRFGLGLAAGAFGIGGILPMAGVGPERLVTGAAAIAGSGVGALGGAGLVGLGSLGTMGFGMGVDGSTMKSTIADTKTLFQNYEQLQQAIEEFGKKSHQAALAQANLNFQMKTLGPGAQFELELAKSVVALNVAYDAQSGKARKLAVDILQQGVSLADQFMPRVLHAAEMNFAIINKDIKPLFSWLEGPQGIKIFNDLEAKFKQDLPTAIDVFSTGVKLLLRTIDLTLPYVGLFTQRLDHLFNRLNNESDFQLSKSIRKLVHDLRIWEAFIKAFAHDAVALFKTGAGEGNSLIETFTHWLQKFGEWETSAKGQVWLTTFFRQRKDELTAMLQIIPPVVKSLAGVYASVQPLVPVITVLSKLVAQILNDLTKMSPALGTLLGVGLLFRNQIPWGRLTGGGGVATGAAAAGVGAAAVRGGAQATLIEDAAAAAGGTSLAGALRSMVGRGAGVAPAVIGTKLISEKFGNAILDGINKYGKFAKAGLALWVASGAIDGLSKAFDTKGDVWAKIKAGVGGFFDGMLGPSLTHDLGGMLGLNKMQTTGGFGDALRQSGQFAVFAGEVKSVGTALGTIDPTILKELIQMGDQLAGDPAMRNYRTQILDLVHVLQGNGVLPAALRDVKGAFADTSAAAGKSMHDIQAAVDVSTAIIQTTLKSGSQSATTALSHNFLLAAQDVQKSMAAGLVSVSSGTAEIEKFLTEALNALGSPIKLKDVKAIGISEATALVGSQQAGGTGATSAGGLRPGGGSGGGFGMDTGGILGSLSAAGRDKYHVVMGEGEAVITRHQRAFIDSMLPRGYNVAGVVGSLRTPNYASRGMVMGGGAPAVDGYVNPYTALTDGRIDQGKDFGGSGPVGAIGPGVVLSNQKWSGWPGTGGVVYRLTSGPRAGEDVYIMEDFQAAVRPGQKVKAGQLLGYATGGQFGIESGWADSSGSHPAIQYNGAADGTPMPGGIDFANFIAGLSQGKVSGPSGALGSIANLVAAQLKDVKVKGLGSGMLEKLAQATVDKVHDAAQSYLDNATAQAGGQLTGFSGGGSAQANRDLGRRMMLAYGWGPDQWPALDALWNQESGWDANAVNPSSGAAGIPQALGHGNVFPLGDAAKQIAWGLAYIRQRYGDPQGAEAHELQYHWYGQGGVNDAHAARDRRPPGPYSQRAHKPKSTGAGSSPSSKTKGKGKRPPRLTGVKRIPAVAGLNPGFDYLYDQEAVDANVLDNTTHLKKYVGGNAAWIDRLGGTEWDLLTGMMDNVNDTDGDGNPIQGAPYMYGEGTWYKGDPANSQGLVTSWKYDQEIAARLKIAMAEAGEYWGAKGELHRLERKYVPNTKDQLRGYVKRAVVEADDIKKFQSYEHYLSVQKNESNFGEKRLHIHQEFEKARSALSIRGIQNRSSIGTVYRSAYYILQQQKEMALAALAASNVLDPTTNAVERDHIMADYDGRQAALAKRFSALPSRSQSISQERARLVLSLAEQDDLFALTREEHAYTTKRSIISEAISKDQHDLKGLRTNAGILLNDLLGADVDAEGKVLRAQLAKIGTVTGDGPVNITSDGSPDIKSEISNRITGLSDAWKEEVLVTIPGLEKQRNNVSGQTSTGAGAGVNDNTSAMLQLSNQLAQYAATDFAVAQNQLAALASFTPVLGRMVGSFYKGGVMPETGLALVHRNETILPDPQGPHAHYPPSGYSGGGDHYWSLQMSGGLEVLAPYIKMVVRKEAQPVVSQQTGRRTRVLQGAPGY